MFAFEDDYAIGVLTSRIHTEWARAQSSTLETRIRYTPTSAFETFPWPEPSEPHRAAIGAIAKDLYALRTSISIDRQIGLTKLYNAIEDGAYEELAELHKRLDEAVAESYGWPKSVAHDVAESNRLLMELNHQILDGEIEYAPFAYSVEGDGGDNGSNG